MQDNQGERGKLIFLTLNLHLKVYLAVTIILKKKIVHLYLGLFQDNIVLVLENTQELQEDLNIFTTVARTGTHYGCGNWDQTREQWFSVQISDTLEGLVERE